MQVRLTDVGQHDVLLVRDSQLARAVLIGEIGNSVHQLGSHVARRHTGLLERERDRRISRHLMRVNVTLRPRGKPELGSKLCQVSIVISRQALVPGTREPILNTLDIRLGQGARAVPEVRPLFLDLLLKALGCALLYQNFYPRFP